MTRKSEQPYKGSLANKVDLLLKGTTQAQTTQSLPLESITLPDYQPRQYFDPQKLSELAATISSRGILEPLLVRPLDQNRFELVAGGRRYRAAQSVGLSSVPVVILSLTDDEAIEVSLLENLQREDLNPVEETEGILRLLSKQLKLERSEVLSLLHRMRNEVKGAASRNVSAREEASIVESLFAPLGLTWKSFVETRLPLLKLPEEILSALRAGQLAYTKAIAIAKLKEPGPRKQLLEETIADNLSLSQIKEKIQQLQRVTDGESNPSEESQLKTTYQRLKKSRLWKKDPKKWKRVATLLRKIETLIEEE